MVVQNRKGENLPIKLLFAFYNFIKLDDAPYNNSYTVNVLSINVIKRYSTALYFVRKKQKVYS